jgi:hypothetical protein
MLECSDLDIELVDVGDLKAREVEPGHPQGTVGEVDHVQRAAREALALDCPAVEESQCFGLKLTAGEEERHGGIPRSFALVDHLVLWQMPIRHRVELASFGIQLLSAARGRAGLL